MPMIKPSILCLLAGCLVVVEGQAARATPMEAIDMNGDGVITEAEFTAFFVRRNTQVPGRVAKAAMKKYDLDGSGLVTRDEIIAVAKGASGAPGKTAAKPADTPSQGNAQGPGGQGQGNGHSGGAGGQGNQGGSNNSQGGSNNSGKNR